MEISTNIGLKIYETTDIFNPMSVEAYNMEKIDAAFGAISAQSSAIQAIETKSGTYHNLATSELPEDLKKFFITFPTAHVFNAGDTIVLNDVPLTAFTSSSATLPQNAWIANKRVVGYVDLDASKFLLVSGGGAGDLSNYATKAELNVVDEKADEATETASEAESLAQDTADDLALLDAKVYGMFTSFNYIVYTNSLPTNPDPNTVYLIPES